MTARPLTPSDTQEPRLFTEVKSPPRTTRYTVTHVIRFLLLLCIEIYRSDRGTGDRQEYVAQKERVRSTFDEKGYLLLATFKIFERKSLADGWPPSVFLTQICFADISIKTFQLYRTPPV